MEFFRNKTSIDFMRQRKLAACFSALIFVASLCAILMNGLNMGLDFTGGTQVIVSFSQPMKVDDLRDQLEKSHPGALIQPYGHTGSFMIKMGHDAQSDANTGTSKGISTEALWNQLQAMFADQKIDIQSVDYIGPQVGKKLKSNGVLAIVVSLLATMLYITLRFDYRFSISAAVALVHDPILILGVFALLQIPFDLITLAAILTIIGYSINDTVVVYDRVRENFCRINNMTTTELMNLSINATLSRTIMTSGLTLLVVLALLFLGGPTLYGFALALAIGIMIGTYSSIYVAGSLAVVMGLKRHHLVSPPKSSNKNQV